VKKAILLALFVVAAADAQSWRENAVASFDEVWQTINDTFYDPTFGGVDWAAAKEELRPRVVSAASPEAARDVIRELLTRLKRSHFVLLAPTAEEAVSGPALVPVEIRITAAGPVIIAVTDRSGTAAGLKPGHVIVSIDGKNTADLIRATEAPDIRSRNLQAWRRVTRELYGADGTRAKLRVRDDKGRDTDISIDRKQPSGEIVALGNLPPLHVVNDTRALVTPRGKRAGYIKFNIWMVPAGEPFAAAVDRFRRDDGIVIDLRGNPGGLASMMSGLAGHFIGEPVVLGSMKTRQTPLPLTYRVNPRIVTSDGRRVDVFAGRLAILVDELTGSTSETFAGALQSLGRARIFGRQTMGQALPAMTKRLPSGDVFMYAMGDFTTVTGRSLEGAGVIPDVLLDLSTQLLLSGRDADLEAALAWIDATK
jgi:carboxyl-terminal processing protease